MNRSAELIRSILSCEEHISIDHEYIIIDNGSTDSTEYDILNLNKKLKNIKYYKQETNLGVARGRNLGYLLASGEICYFIDDDAVVSTEGMILDEGYKAILSDNDLFAMSTNCFDTSKDCFVIGGFRKGEPFGKMGYVKGFTGFSHFIAKYRIQWDYLYPNNIMYGSEELYFALNTFREGKKILFFEPMCITHIPSSSTRNSSYWQKKNAYINTYVIKKYFVPAIFMWLSFFFFLGRALKNEHFKFWNLFDYCREAKLRYDSKYCRKMSILQEFQLIKLYGILSAL